MKNQNVAFFSEDMEQRIAETVISIVTQTFNETRQRPAKRYFKKKDFCQEIGCSFNTLQKWINELSLPVVILEGTQLIDMQDFILFAQKHKI